MIFFQGTPFNFFYKPFSMSSLLVSKTFICLYVKTNLHKIAFVPLTGAREGDKALAECPAKKVFFTCSLEEQ